MVMGCTNYKVKIGKVFFPKETFIGSISVKNPGFFTEFFCCGLRMLVVIVDKYNVLGCGKIVLSNSFKKRVFLWLNDFFSNEGSNPTGPYNGNFFKFLLL